MDIIIKLFSNKSVLVAAWALVRALLSWAAPSVPPGVIAAIDSFAAAIIAVVAVNDVKNVMAESRNAGPEAGNDF